MIDDRGKFTQPQCRDKQSDGGIKVTKNVVEISNANNIPLVSQAQGDFYKEARELHVSLRDSWSAVCAKCSGNKYLCTRMPAWHVAGASVTARN